MVGDAAQQRIVDLRRVELRREDPDGDLHGVAHQVVEGEHPVRLDVVRPQRRVDGILCGGIDSVKSQLPNNDSNQYLEYPERRGELVDLGGVEHEVLLEPRQRRLQVGLVLFRDEAPQAVHQDLKVGLEERMTSLATEKNTQ